MVKNLPVRQETRVRSLGWEVPLEKGMAIHSSILAWRIKFHGQRSLVGYSLWGGKESDTTQRLTLHFHLFRFLVVATHSNPCLCHFGAFCPRLLSIFSSYWTRANPTQNGLILTYILITSAKALSRHGHVHMCWESGLQYLRKTQLNHKRQDPLGERHLPLPAAPLGVDRDVAQAHLRDRLLMMKGRVSRAQSTTPSARPSPPA